MFDPSQLSAIAYCNGFTLWHYRTPDAADAVQARGYFNEAVGMLRQGDLVILHALDADTTVPTFLFVAVSDDQANTIEVHNTNAPATATAPPAAPPKTAPPAAPTP